MNKVSVADCVVLCRRGSDIDVLLDCRRLGLSSSLVDEIDVFALSRFTKEGARMLEE
jgi:hypothetical protein